jgi:hypothetical protein
MLAACRPESAPVETSSEPVASSTAAVAVSDREPHPFVGTWAALVPFDGQELRLELELEDAGSDDVTKKLRGRIHIADFGMLNLPLLTQTISGRQISLTSAFALQFDGMLQPDDNSITGSFGVASASPTQVRLIRDNPAFEVFRVPRMAASGTPEVSYRYTPPTKMDDGWEVGNLADHNDGERAARRAWPNRIAVDHSQWEAVAGGIFLRFYARQVALTAIHQQKHYVAAIRYLHGAGAD